jgi:DNA-binding NarL/FixJ family response regulator
METPTRVPSRDPTVEPLGTLTFRERGILGLLAGGLTARHIAQELCLSYHTIRSHLFNLYLKLGVHSQVEAVRFAMDRGGMEATGPLGWERRSA